MQGGRVMSRDSSIPKPAVTRAPGPPSDSPQRGTRFHRAFTAGDRATREVLADLVAALSRGGIHEDDLWTLELILAEALNNVTEHAYAGGCGPVELEVVQRCDGLACRVSDRGRPMPGDDPPDPPLPAIEPPDTLPEGGFGWHIIRCLSTELTYRRDGGWNTLTMLVPTAGTSIEA
jgi:serine/threonine-protein kinase RsbW